MPNLLKSSNVIRQSRKSGAAFIAFSAALLLIFIVAGKCRAGIAVGDKPPGMSDEQFYKMSQDAAEKDLERKYAVGQRRYDQRMAVRTSIINGMNGQFEARRKSVDVVPVVAVAAAVENKVDYLGCAIWTLAIAVMALGAWQWYRSRQQVGLVEA